MLDLENIEPVSISLSLIISRNNLIFNYVWDVTLVVMTSALQIHPTVIARSNS